MRAERAWYQPPDTPDTPLAPEQYRGDGVLYSAYDCGGAADWFRVIGLDKVLALACLDESFLRGETLAELAVEMGGDDVTKELARDHFAPLINQGRFVIREQGLLHLCLEKFNLRVHFWNAAGEAKVAKHSDGGRGPGVTLLTHHMVVGPEGGRLLHVLCPRNDDETMLRLMTDDDRPRTASENQEMREHFVAHWKERVHFGTNANSAHFYESTITSLGEYGIPALLRRYEASCEKPLPEKFPSFNGDGPDTASYYEFCPERPDRWQRYDLPRTYALKKALHSPQSKRLVSIRGHVPALLFMEYISRIGGNNALPESLGDECVGVDLFHFFSADTDLGWFPLEVVPRADFPSDALQKFFTDDFTRVKQSFLSMIGQEKARLTLAETIFAQAAFAFVEKTPLPSLEHLNMVFSGEPGVGKTSLAQQVASLMFYAGLTQFKFCEMRTGATLGSGTGTADQGALFVKRVYQRARGAVLFIDELPGVTSDPPTSNQLSVVCEITARSLLGICCTIGAGYASMLQSNFFARDIGLDRRYTEIPFVPYTGEELLAIFIGKAAHLLQHFAHGVMECLRWLHAGFVARNVNGGFADKLVEAFNRQRSTKRFRNHGSNLTSELLLEQLDVVHCWQWVLHNQRSFQCRAVFNHQVLLARVSHVQPHHSFADILLQKANVYARELLLAAKCIERDSDQHVFFEYGNDGKLTAAAKYHNPINPSRLFVFEYDPSGDGMWGLFLYLLDMLGKIRMIGVTSVPLNVSFSCGALSVTVSFEKQCPASKAQGEWDLALSVLDCTVWDFKDTERSCFLFKYTNNSPASTCKKAKVDSDSPDFIQEEEGAQDQLLLDEFDRLLCARFFPAGEFERIVDDKDCFPVFFLNGTKQWCARKATFLTHLERGQQCSPLWQAKINPSALIALLWRANLLDRDDISIEDPDNKRRPQKCIRFVNDFKANFK